MAALDHRRPVVGVTGSSGRGRLMWWFNRLAVWLAGGRALRITPEDDVDPYALDALMVGGGDDIGAELYRGALTPDIKVDPDRDMLELELLAHAAAHDLPVLGICRGAQMMNVFCGGNLHQDVKAVFRAAAHRRQVLPRKRIGLVAGSRLADIIGGETLYVNALHHQAIDRLGDGLEVSARDRHDMVQAVEDPSAPFFLGVQWHPEFVLWRGKHRRLFRALIQATDQQIRRLTMRRAGG